MKDLKFSASIPQILLSPASLFSISRRDTLIIQPSQYQSEHQSTQNYHHNAGWKNISSQGSCTHHIHLTGGSLPSNPTIIIIFTPSNTYNPIIIEKPIPTPTALYHSITIHKNRSHRVSIII
jgi:hypothetical protein